jgi:hypothetical protein
MLFHDAFTALAPKVAKIEVLKQDNTPDSGTAFFVEDGTHMVTNSHVVEHSSELNINYQGKLYPAVVEKIDDINDLAELKVIGLDADPSRSQKVGPVTLTPNERVFSVGVPGVPDQVKYLNPGLLDHSDRLYNILTAPHVVSEETARIQAAFNSGDPVMKQMAQDRANAPRFVMNQGVRSGESGSPIDDVEGNLVAVMTSANGNNASVDVPYTKVQELLANTDNKYNINYSIDHEFVMPALVPAASDTLGLGAEVAGVLGKGRLAPLAYAGVRAVSLFSEVKDLSSASTDVEKHELEYKIGQDATMIAGGALATALWSSPVGRYIGLGAMGLSLASRFISDSEKSHYRLDGVTRKNGDTHPLWNI